MYIGFKYSPAYNDEDERQRFLQVRVTKLLLAYGARNSDIRNKYGYSPVLSLAEQGFADAVKVLLEHGAATTSDRVIDTTSSSSSINVFPDGGVFPVFAMLAGHAGRDNESREQIYDEKLASMLGEYVVPLVGRPTAPANSQSTTSKTLLHHVVRARLIESAAVLLHAGANVNAVFEEISNINGLATRRPKTPLDEILEMNPFVAGERFSKSGQ